MSSLTIVNYPYLISSLSCWLLFHLHISSLLASCPRLAETIKDFLSFIGLETSHRRGPEKRSVIDVATSIIDGIDTGVNFLLLWGRKRALKWRLGPIGYWFNQNACLVKPQEESINMAIQGTFRGGSTRQVVCCLGCGSLHTYTSTLPCKSHSLPVTRFILLTTWYPDVSGVPGYGHHIYWVIEQEVGQWKFPVLDTLLNQ